MGLKTKVNYLPKIEEDILFPLIEQWQQEYPEMGICAFLPEAEKNHLPKVQEILKKKKVSLVGAIFPELVNVKQFVKEGILLFCLEKMPDYQIFENLAEGGAHIAKSISNKLGNNKDESLFLLFDAMIPNIGSILDEIYLELANRVNYFGANAGSESFQNMPCLFDDTRIIGLGLLVMILPEHKGAVLEHGYQIPEKTFFATSTSGNRIKQIDWRPAFQVYKELVKKQFGIEMNQTNFYELAVHYPFGILQATNQALVRIPVALNDDESLFCVGEVKENSVLTLLECPIVDSKETLDIIQKRLISLNGKETDRGILLFYCAGRRLHLGVENAEKEISDFSDLTSESNLYGALSLGEIGGSTIQGYPSFHNATIVATNW